MVEKINIHKILRKEFRPKINFKIHRMSKEKLAQFASIDAKEGQS